MLTISVKRQRGITLLESLIALVVASLGILGIVGVQLRTLSDTQNTVRREQAIRLIEDLSERMKVNPNAMGVMGSYISNFANEPALSGCTSGCTPATQAAYDLALWKQAVKTLPMGRASIFVPPGEAAINTGRTRQLGVMVAWRENESKDLTGDDKKQIDATQVRAADGSLSAGGGADTAVDACPSGFTCHLQYIPISARCAPYKVPSKAGSTAPTQDTRYFCPGN
ncbi:type IV pilus modification protein PilV [Comamonas odontotermitis]|uniref:type IV pilus modification protein PilV n=1 Tax=Comamonas odontotermitis TaxID=379895 RepID=UPI00320BDD00